MSIFRSPHQFGDISDWPTNAELPTIQVESVRLSSLPDRPTVLLSVLEISELPTRPSTPIPPARQDVSEELLRILREAGMDVMFEW